MPWYWKRQAPCNKLFVQHECLSGYMLLLGQIAQHCCLAYAGCDLAVQSLVLPLLLTKIICTMGLLHHCLPVLRSPTAGLEALIQVGLPEECH